MFDKSEASFQKMNAIKHTKFEREKKKIRALREMRMQLQLSFQPMKRKVNFLNSKRPDLS